MICPRCKDGSSFTQTKPNVFTCKACGFKLKIDEDLQAIWVTVEGKTYVYLNSGWFEKK